jgi:hypothetical protein
MNRTLLYVLGVYLSFLCFGVYLKTAHGEEVPAQPAPVQPAPEANTGTFLQGGFPYVAHTDAPLRIKPAKPCREYLTLCERSCRDRGDMFRFVCIGQDFQPYDDHFRCQCFDDLTGNGIRISRSEQEL